MKLEFVEAGQIVTSHGLKGEMKVLPWGDSPEFLTQFHRVSIEGQPYEVELCRVQKGCNLLKLKGVDSCDAAMALKDKTLSIFRIDADPDTIFASEMEGVEAFAEGKSIGKVTEVLDYPGNLVYVVQGEYEYMIPAVKAFVQNIDLEANRMDVTLIEGMRSDED